MEAEYPSPPYTPAPAYQATSIDSALHTNRALYSTIASAPKELVSTFVLPIRSGRAWTVPAGCVCRITTPEGPQVGKWNFNHEL